MLVIDNYMFEYLRLGKNPYVKDFAVHRLENKKLNELNADSLGGTPMIIVECEDGVFVVTFNKNILSFGGK